MCHDVLIRALHAYVCWRIAAGVVGWAWLLLGLATDRLGATNALVAAMHIRAAAALVLCIFDCSMQLLAAPARLSWLASVSKAAGLMRTVVFPTVPWLSGVVLSDTGKRAWQPELGRAATAPRDERGLPEIWPGRCRCALVLPATTGGTCGAMPR